MKPPPDAPRFLYHVTFASKLDDGIAEEGLDADRGSTFGGGYAGHTAGRIFLCDAGAVACWWGKIDDQANHHFEGREIVDGNHVPVILRTAVTTGHNPSGLDWGDLEVDEIGSNDCIGGTSYYAEDQAIDVTWLQVWDGRQWLDVEGARADEIAPAYLASVEENQDEDDEDALSWTEVEMAIPPGWDADEAVRQENPARRAHATLPLAEVERWEPLAAALGVSEVARSREGFLGAYRAAKGRLTALSPYWRARREAFLARHLAQAAHEPLFRDGQPTRRHLALVMWAYSPEAARLKRLSPLGAPGDRHANPAPLPQGASCPAQGPIFERDATLEEVERAFVRSYEAGRHGKKPDAATLAGLREKGPRWVLATLPLRLLNYQREADEVSGERLARAQEYASRLTRNVPPGIAFYGDRSRRQRTLRAYVKDGNHRALAHELAGKPLVKMWMPKEDFEVLQRQATGFA